MQRAAALTHQRADSWRPVSNLIVRRQRETSATFARLWQRTPFCILVRALQTCTPIIICHDQIETQRNACKDDAEAAQSCERFTIHQSEQIEICSDAYL